MSCIIIMVLQERTGAEPYGSCGLKYQEFKNSHPATASTSTPMVQRARLTIFLLGENQKALGLNLVLIFLVV